ncbi:unnamed protein product [Rotaria sordida]|uniref:Uncharacterized protein n=1 Tax=Rotaria sordida TaxID=392033 RepID=A0A815R6N8_9BILA|nr:unnamed protein product [Rotaria sordida]CAF4123689.1 unnamed protein product [Rotaria sordida]
MIEAANGKNIAGYTMYPDEHEVILGVGIQLRVKDIGFQHGNLRVVHLEEVDDNADDHQEELPAAMATTYVTPKLSKPSSQPTLRESFIYFPCFQ